VANKRVTSIVTLVRRQCDTFPQSDKIKQVIVDFEALDNAKLNLGQFEVAFSCLGTTRGDAGSDAAFRKVDLTYVVNFATFCKNSLGVKHFHLVSSEGASSKSLFLYLRTKGEAEDGVNALNFDYAAAYQPGFLDRGEDARPTEKIVAFLSKILTTDKLAQAMISNMESAWDSKASGNTAIPAGAIKKLLGE